MKVIWGFVIKNLQAFYDFSQTRRILEIKSPELIDQIPKFLPLQSSNSPAPACDQERIPLNDTLDYYLPTRFIRITQKIHNKHKNIVWNICYAVILKCD